MAEEDVSSELVAVVDDAAEVVELTGDRDGQDVSGVLGSEGDAEQPGPTGLVDPVATGRRRTS